MKKCDNCGTEQTRKDQKYCPNCVLRFGVKVSDKTRKGGLFTSWQGVMIIPFATNVMVAGMSGTSFNAEAWQERGELIDNFDKRHW